MCPNEFDKYREELISKCAEAFGWQRYEREVHHERDSCPSWTEEGFTDAGGTFLISDKDLSEGLAKELIRLARERLG